MVVKAAFAVAMFLLTTNMLVSVATRSPDNLLNSFPEETGHVYSASTVQKMTEYKPTTEYLHTSYLTLDSLFLDSSRSRIQFRRENSHDWAQ
uniref:H0811D08.13 protein n=1 Tax=Oryza sativa TaxID=4530 RepID=Q25A12_ORYSA|nr:H0821G03.4 [Oryza sativa]CAJ86117.1 H0811D08.13 [Oryza sativa]